MAKATAKSSLERSKGAVHGQALPFSRRSFTREPCKRRHVKREDRVEKDNKGWRLGVSLRYGLAITKPSQKTASKQ